MENNNILSIKNLSKLYGTEKSKATKLKKAGKDKDTIYKESGVTIALWDVNLEIQKGEIFVIIGLSGSGKSTLVRCFNLLNKPTSGKVYFEGNDIGKFSKEKLNDYRRNKISMVFQQFGLMSHRSVIGNVEYGLEIKGLPKEERRAKAKEMINMVGLEGHDDEPITSLSGGMKQRVGIARALANDPEILLMDEPFSALDPLVRKDMQFELLTIQEKLDKTIVFITHDINEAFKIGDRVAVMKDGEIVQIGTPEEILENPSNQYIEDFVRDIDRSKVFQAKHIMQKTTAIMSVRDGLNVAMREMRSNGLSSLFVVGENRKLEGIVTIDDTINAIKEKGTLKDILKNDYFTADPEDYVQDLIPKAAVTKYPIAVIGENDTFLGIIVRVSVLSGLT